MDQKKVAFTKRSIGSRLRFARSHVPGNLFNGELSLNDAIVLKIDSERAHATVIEDVGNDRFKARIDTFESPNVSEYGGYKVGDTVSFEETDAWSTSNEEER